MDIEQSTLIWIIRVIFALIAFAISFGLWRFMRRERLIVIPKKPAYQPPENTEIQKKNITLTLMAKPGYFFENNNLFSTLEEAGFIYTDNKIFEYMIDNTNYVAFSLINIRQPYTFDIKEKNPRINNGLRAVMRLPVADGDQQSNHFHLMLSVLEELGVRLDAQLCDANHYPMKNSKLYDIQKEIESFEQSYAHLMQNG